MIYSTQVHNILKNTGKISVDDKVASVRELFIVANIVAFFFIRQIYKNFLGLGTIPTILTILGLDFALGFWYFSVFVFKIDEKRQTEKESDSDSFARYIRLNGESQDDVFLLSDTVHTFVYGDGTLTSTFRIMCGSNDNSKTEENKRLLEHIHSIAGLYDLEIRVSVMREDFKLSPEYRSFVRSINDYSEQSTANALISTMDLNIKESRKSSNVPVIYVTYKTRSPMWNEQLIPAITMLFSFLPDCHHSFRSITSLDIDELKEYYQLFYTVGAIDLTLVKAVDYAVKTEQELAGFDDKITTVSLYRKDGKVVPVAPLKGYFKTKEEPLNAKRTSDSR